MSDGVEQRACDQCGQALGEPFAHCGNCQEDYCLGCGSHHFCMPSCQANGCIAGLCVRLVINGQRSSKWGVPRELLGSAPDGAAQQD
jgi:hypothetical protein